jgi:hypothetical protein
MLSKIEINFGSEKNVYNQVCVKIDSIIKDLHLLVNSKKTYYEWKNNCNVGSLQCIKDILGIIFIVNNNEYNNEKDVSCFPEYLLKNMIRQADEFIFDKFDGKITQKSCPHFFVPFQWKELELK